MKPTMTLAVVSDIHGNLPALDAVIDDIASSGADLVVNLGDCLSGPLWPSETADLLMALGWPTLAGNHERQMLTAGTGDPATSDGFALSRLRPDQKAWLAGLPGHIALAPDLLLCHGTPDSDTAYWLHRGRPGAMRKATVEEVAAFATSHRLALCGHTHVPRTVTLQDGRIVANPGSIGLPAYDDDGNDPDIAEAGGPRARYLIAHRHAQGSWSIESRSVPYDFERAARQAERNGRLSWAYVLRTGRIWTA